MMVGTPSTGASLGQKRGELERKIKEAERERKKYELAAKRIEKALVELQVFQNDRMEKLLPLDGFENQREDATAAPGDLEAVMNEQRAYIRVLEEAVHLKATDFEVTGHEELLIVLAELRHTIYEQEKDVDQKNSTVATIQEQLEQEKQHHLETKTLLVGVQKQQEEMTRRFQEQESALHAQIDEAQGEIKQRDKYLSRLEGASTDAQRAEEALQSHLTAAMKTKNLTDSKLEDAMRNINALQEQLGLVTTKFEEAKRQARSLQEDCTKKQAHLDELNALQEELLASVDKYVNKVKKSRDKVERLEAELQSSKEKQALTKTQAEDASRSSSEQLTALSSKICEAERREQQVQTQFTALQQEKNRLESTLAEVQQSMLSQAQEIIEQQQELATKEKECNQIKEAVAELEAALSTALRMMLSNSAERLTACEAQNAVEIDKSSIGSDEYSFLLDQSVLRDFRVCCQALNTLSTDNACAMLDSTAQMCQDEMEKRHEEICQCRQQLTECTLEVEAYAMQVDTLDEQLRRAEAECEAFHALEQHAANQEKVLEAKETLIRELSTEHDRLVAVENAYSVQHATNTRLTQQLEDQREAMNEQRNYSEELEHALENAATFAEQQNGCNQQLTGKLAAMESSSREQTDHLKSLELQTSTFSSRFLGLVKQYITFLRPTAATDRSLQDHLNQLDAEIQNGDTLRLLRLFPALIEKYVSTCSGSSVHSPVGKRCTTSISSGYKKLQYTGGWSAEKPRRLHQQADMDTPTWQAPPHSKSLPPSPPPPLEVAAPKTPRLSLAAEKEEAQLAEQLELIRGAFQSYKADVGTTDR
ncbi:Myosin heavy chain [Phytophthora cinnamomi]|uniref:Myosin heavy chain n=1 Tax=Phytophthora cinnamomi TaxID=4785 RepID=UPI00355A4BBC|nr:Myosin heavy chain [Phytophthora cinnamomi]